MNRKPAEFWLMLLVIAITAWHVRSFLATKDHEVASWIIGAVLGACCFLFAHRFFSGGAARVPAFFALVISAAYSVNMQYAYFDAKDIADNALIYDVAGWNLNAMVLGLWAPTFEVLLGWLYSAMTKGQPHHKSTGPSPWAVASNALAHRIAVQLQSAPSQASQLQSDAPTMQSQPSQIAERKIVALPPQATEALNMQGNGMTIAEIAEALRKSERTVSNYLKQAKEHRPVTVATNGHSKEAHT